MSRQGTSVLVCARSEVQPPRLYQPPSLLIFSRAPSHRSCIEPGRVSPDTAAHHAASALRPGKAYTLTQEVVLHYAA